MANNTGSASFSLSLPIFKLGFLVTVVFFILKLAGPLASWDWFFIWLPLLIGVGWHLFGIVLGVLLILVGLAIASLTGSTRLRGRSSRIASPYRPGGMAGGGTDFRTPRQR